MFIQTQFDPSSQAFNSPGKPGVVSTNNLISGQAYTFIIKNWSTFDILFQATDELFSFYVEAHTARAFHLSLTNWKLTFLPINMNGLLSTSVLLPYSQVTIEAYFENEDIIEVYPQTLTPFALPPLEILSRNSFVYMVGVGVLTSPTSGNMPLGLFWPASNTRLTTLTILSVKLTCSAVVNFDVKLTGVDPNFTGANVAGTTNMGVATAPALHVTNQNTTVSKVAGQPIATGVAQPGINELLAPGLLTAQSQDFPIGGALSGGVNFYMTPSAATTYSWNVLWKEELQ